MSADIPIEQNEDLLNDFFSESDEHLTQIRQGLAQLENSIGKAQAEQSVVEGLFRAFHSLKGISAIVGLRSVEELAHGTEDFLRELRKGRRGLNRKGIDLLMSATQGIERSVLAFRSKQTLPNHARLIGEIRGGESS